MSDPMEQLEELLATSRVYEACNLATDILARPTLANAQGVIDRFNAVSGVPSAPIRVYVLSSFTVQPFVLMLRALGLTARLNLDIRFCDFNAYGPAILDDASELYIFNPQFVILALETRAVAPGLWNGCFQNRCGENVQTVEMTIDYVLGFVKELRNRSTAEVIVQNLDQTAVLGISDSQSIAGSALSIQAVNRGLTEALGEITGVYVLDYNALVGRHGRDRWYDSYRWHTARMPFAPGAIPMLAREYLKFIVSLSGRSCKAVAVDLDNTLWGGILGEDGLTGIRLGSEYPGIAYLELQHELKRLRSEGFLLCICSRNNHSDAVEAIDNHPEMVLRSRDFTILKANWQDKADNLRAIAAELNIGLDSVAFIDDSPVECARIRQSLPAVQAIHLPGDPLQYAPIIRDSVVLSRVNISNEDLQRSQYYDAERQKATLRESVSSLEEFHRSLETVAVFQAVDPTTLARAAQLTQKTNQFNVTTRRYTEAQMSAFIADPNCETTVVRLQDRFGDNGMVGLSIMLFQGTVCTVDTLLLSCRVIGRTVETALLARMCELARSRGAGQIEASFLQTSKNRPASEVFAQHGFDFIGAADGATYWKLNLATKSIDYPEWITVRINEEVY